MEATSSAYAPVDTSARFSRTTSISPPDCSELLLRASRLPSIMSTTMSLAEFDQTRQDPSRRQSQAESISTLWSSADVPLFFDTRPSLSAISEHKSGLDAPISLGPTGGDSSEDAREILSQQESSPAMMSDSTPRSSFDPIPGFPASNASPSSFAASRYGRKHSQESPRRRPPPLQLQSSSAFQALSVQPLAFPASLSHGSELTMVPGFPQEAPQTSAARYGTIPSPRTAMTPVSSTGSHDRARPTANQQPVLQQRRSSLKKKGSTNAISVPDQPVPSLQSPAFHNRLYAKASQIFQADYSLSSPVTNIASIGLPVANHSASAPPSAAFANSSPPHHISRESSLSSEANSMSREDSMPGSLSHTSTSSGMSSSCFMSSEDGQATSPCRNSFGIARQLFPAGSEMYATATYGLKNSHGKGFYQKSVRLNDAEGPRMPGQMYAVLPPTPQRMYHSQQASHEYVPMSVVASRHGMSESSTSRLPLISTHYLGPNVSNCTPMVQSPMALPTPVSSFSEASEAGSTAASASIHSAAGNQGPSWSHNSPFVSPTQPIPQERPEKSALRLRTTSASRLLHAASMKLLRNEPASDVPPLPLPKNFPQGQRPSTATTDGCNLRPRARTVGDKERPVSLQPAPRIPDKLTSDSFGTNGQARSPQGSLIPLSTMTSSSTAGKAFRPKSKGGWASHLSGGLTLHIDQDNQRSVQINLSYLSYDPFGRSDSLVPANVEGTARPSTPKRSSRLPRGDEDDQTGVLEFGPMNGVDESWVFQSSGGTSAAPMLRHLTVGPELKADILTRQAKLNLCTDGVHEVFGSEKKGRLGWRFIYRVEPCLGGSGRSVASGEKILRPLKFLCSATLLDPSRAQKSRLINLVRKQVNANLESTPVRSPGSTSLLSEPANTTASSVPSPLSSSAWPNPFKTIHSQHPQLYTSQQAQQLQLQPQHQLHSTQVIHSATGLPISATHSLRAQNSPYSIAFSGSTASLVSPLPSPSVRAAVQRLDPALVTVPANLPVGVVPFKLVRQPIHKASNLSLSSVPAPTKVPGHDTATTLSRPTRPLVPSDFHSAPASRNVSASLPRVRTTETSRPSLPSFGERKQEAQHFGLQPSPMPQPCVRPRTDWREERLLPENFQDLSQVGQRARRTRAHTGGETKVKRPMTASELIKRQWEQDQKCDDGTPSAHGQFPNGSFGRTAVQV
ncbi:hypothetical protein CF326_g99 [Tilletia indica]|nr:hypothetical protein CF326_g99 [Tilletia indica]